MSFIKGEELFLHDPNAKMDYLSDSDILLLKLLFSYVWDRSKSKDFLQRNISHILFLSMYIIYHSSHIPSLLRRGTQAPGQSS